MAELSAVPFSALLQAGDGYTVLYENNQVCRSEKKLSELVGDKTSSFLTREEGDSLYQEKGNYLVADDITGKLDKSQYAVDSATFLTAHQDISNKLDTTAFSTVSGDFLTDEDITGKMDKSESANFYPMTGNPSGFLTQQSLDEYATQEWVNDQGFLKEHQPISADKWNDVYETVVSNSGTWETETDWTDDINDASAYAYEQAIAQIPAPFDPTFLSGEIDKKLDKTFSSNFYPMTGNPSGFLKEHQDISNKLDTSSFSEVSGTFLTDEDITGKMDKSFSSNFYPMESNPSGYLTEHQSLDGYATEDWVENKNYLTNEDIEGKLDTSSFSEVSGKTGPYILYSALRIRKILTTNTFNKGNVSDTIYNDIDKNLRLKLLDFNKYLDKAIEDRLPSVIAEYVYDLANLLNSFYQNINISKIEDETMKNDYLNILDLSFNVLKECLDLLIIELPSEM